MIDQPHHYHNGNCFRTIFRVFFAALKFARRVPQVQFGTKATDLKFRRWHKIEKIVIHPDYWQVGLSSKSREDMAFLTQGPNEVAQPHDVALAMIEKEVHIISFISTVRCS